MLEHTSTIIAAAPMPRALSTEVVTASVGQVPSTSRNTGFSLIRPLVNSLPRLFFSAICRTSCHLRIELEREINRIRHRFRGDRRAG